MELILLCAIPTALMITGVTAYTFLSVFKLKYHNPKRIAELESELKRQATIVDLLDKEALDELKEKLTEVHQMQSGLSMGMGMGLHNRGRK